MPTEEQIRDSLNEVIIPGVMRSPVRLNLVREVTVLDDNVNVVLASAALSSDAQNWLKDKVSDIVKKLPGVNEVAVDFIEAKPGELNDISYVIAVMSGKGGVGKSLVTSLLGVALARQGKEVGILDADITGPSIPRMFGISQSRPTGSDSGMMPVLSKMGIGIMSINLVLENEDDAVIWRGPLIGKAIQQFWGDVLWGKLDYLIVDLPPGTADAPLTVMQSLPVSGVVIVFSPQELAAMVVRKAMKMVQQMDIPILGMVENMSYFVLPDSGKKLKIFGESRGEEMTKLSGTSLLAQIPIDPELARLCDEGAIERYDLKVFKDFAQDFAQILPLKAKQNSIT